MAVNITLTSSMRSNLSSLKSLASQMSTTQTRLSTGKKVNNAIDNANSYYQARALTNRASDLDMLLDSMGQSIQTITSAVKGLESSGEILENAAVIAKEAYEAEKTIEVSATKEYFAELVGKNGAVVSTAQELKDAIAANKETICVYGKIDYFENQTIEMKANQKLVGTEYFTGYTGNKKFSEINFSGTQYRAILAASNCLISDLSLNFESYTSNRQTIRVSDGVSAKINNLDINHNNINGSSGSWTGVISSMYSSNCEINGVINITGTNLVCALDAEQNGKIHVGCDAVINVKCDVNFAKPITIYTGGSLFFDGKLNIDSKQSSIFYFQKNGILHLSSGVNLKLNDKYNGVSLQSKDYIYEHSQSGSSSISSQKLLDSGCFEKIDDGTDWSTWNPIPERGDVEEPTRIVYDKEQFDTTLTSFDEMVSDSSYQGINLIKGGKLTTMFNEDRTHSYTVEGADMSLSGLGITTREWQTKGDIAASIKEIQNAMSSIRDEVARLGNNLSIIETRMNFTDGLVDVLQTGADDLVLADMNEESANYLALQTRNNLAVNALALAAQSNNAVLKLF